MFPLGFLIITPHSASSFPTLCPSYSCSPTIFPFLLLLHLFLLSVLLLFLNYLLHFFSFSPRLLLLLPIFLCPSTRLIPPVQLLRFVSSFRFPLPSLDLYLLPSSLFGLSVSYS